MAKEFFSPEEQKQIVESIQKAEKDTSGEVRVHIENRCKTTVLERATKVFKILSMDKTEQRNGVLFYLAIKDHKFAILGDKGINDKVPSDFWESIKNHMQALFKEGKFTQGLSDGILMAGEQLGKHFPYQSGDINELPDDITFGNN
jgi:uncharacterized membrane protein